MAEQDLLNRTTQELRQRLRELEPLLEEQRRLQRALEALEGIGAPEAGQRGRPRKDRRAGTRRAYSGRARRGERQGQLLAAIRRSPGSRPADLARTIGAAPSQTHVLLRRLQESEQVERREGGFFVRGGASRSGSETNPAVEARATEETSAPEGSEGEALRQRMSDRMFARTESAPESE